MIEPCFTSNLTNCTQTHSTHSLGDLQSCLEFRQLVLQLPKLFLTEVVLLLVVLDLLLNILDGLLELFGVLCLVLPDVNLVPRLVINLVRTLLLLDCILVQFDFTFFTQVPSTSLCI